MYFYSTDLKHRCTLYNRVLLETLIIHENVQMQTEIMTWQ